MAKVKTPWGLVISSKKYMRGVSYVRTASHGGFILSKGFAEKNLSIAALKRGTLYNGYYCFEEDIKANIVLLEMPELREEQDDSDGILKSLSAWHPDYLLEVNITPFKTQYQSYLIRKEDARLRAEKSPNLIVSAMSLSERADVVRVWTADDTSHYVTKESYHSVKNAGLPLIQNCELIKL
jgi:hypothetical protein